MGLIVGVGVDVAEVGPYGALHHFSLHDGLRWFGRKPSRHWTKRNSADKDVWKLQILLLSWQQLAVHIMCTCRLCMASSWLDKVHSRWSLLAFQHQTSLTYSLHSFLHCLHFHLEQLKTPPEQQQCRAAQGRTSPFGRQLTTTCFQRKESVSMQQMCNGIRE